MYLSASVVIVEPDLSHQLVSNSVSNLVKNLFDNSCNRFLNKPLVKGFLKVFQTNNTFEIAKIVRQSSPLLSKKTLSLQPDKQQQKLEQAEAATQSLFALWDDSKIPSCIDVLSNLKESGLYEISERMEEIIDAHMLGTIPKL